MEEREEKTKEINVRIQSSSSKSCSHADLIPFDLTWEILLRLPAKSLMRFQCVSKLWSSITSDSGFINSFKTLSSVQRSCLMLNFEKNDKQIFFSLSQQKKNLEMCLPHVEKRHLTMQKRKRYRPIFQFQSVHGLVCFHYLNHIVIWNPSRGHCITFPKPSQLNSPKSYLGYDPIGNTYKVLSMSYTVTDEARVFTLGGEASWRQIKDIPKRSLDCKGICINGVLYLIVDKETPREIMSFDVRSEKVKLIQIPSCMHKFVETDLSLVSYKGKLAWIILESSFYKLWVLDDAGKEEWSCKDFHLPFSPKDHVDYRLSGVTDDGEFVYVSVSWKDKEIYVCYYDPLRNSKRKIKIEKIEDDDFWLGDWKFIGSLPNHIENLMSLKKFTCSSIVRFFPVS